MLRYDRIPPTPAFPPGITPEWAAGGSGAWPAPGFCFMPQMAGTTREGQYLLRITGSSLGYQFKFSSCQQKQSWLVLAEKHMRKRMALLDLLPGIQQVAVFSPNQSCINSWRCRGTAACEMLRVTVTENGLKSKAQTGHWNDLDLGRSH